ncbi:MAG: hypothetical protein KJO43_02850, partial [Phycisphaerae bacterium]|nr:hypothetical protein [Phycisphaerae bacterium]
MSDKVRTFKMLASFAGVAAVLTALIVWPNKLQTGVADTPPETLELTGLVRDFRKSHADFAVTPSNGPGHYADTIAYGMDHRHRPVASGFGFRVDEQWRDSEGRPIAPHMAGVRGGPGGGDVQSLGLRVEGDIHLHKDAVVDAFSSSLGAYGLRGNHGGMAYASTNSTEKDAVKIHDKSIFRGSLDVGPGADIDEVTDIKGTVLGPIGSLALAYPMPDPDAPEDLQSYQEHVHLEGTVTLTGDMFPDDEVDEPAMHFGKLHIKEDSVITVEGDLTIVVDDELKFKKTQIVVLPDATLTIYALGKYCEFKEGTIFQTDGHSTTAVTIVALGTGDVKIEKDSHIYGTIIAPGRKLKIKDGHLYGGFVGGEADLEGKGAGVHVDTQNADQGPWNFAITVRDKIEIEDDSVVDSFDSNVGPYGGANVGENALLMTNAIKKDKVKIKDRSVVNGDVLVGPGASPLRVIKLEHDAVVNGTRGALFRPNSVPVVAPPILGLTDGDVELKGGEHTISGDLRCKKLKLEEKCVVYIAGHVTIRCDDKLEMKDRSRIELLPASSLTLHVKKEITLDDRCSINMNTGNPQLVSIRRSSLGKKGKIEIKKKSQICAWIQGAKCELKIEDESEFFGSFCGEKIKLKDDSQLHVDMAYLNACVE